MSMIVSVVLNLKLINSIALVPSFAKYAHCHSQIAVCHFEIPIYPLEYPCLPSTTMPYGYIGLMSMIVSVVLNLKLIDSIALVP